MKPVAKNPKQPPSEPPVCARIKRNIQLDSALQAQAGRDWRRAEQSLGAIEAEIPALRAEVRRLETLSVLPHTLYRHADQVGWWACFRRHRVRARLRWPVSLAMLGADWLKLNAAEAPCRQRYLKLAMI